ncbi:hypothetical protein LWM68_08205 [Niabella sp. W65]|nr:hypothetical protein [Niabella sp. W65]MCH7362747.1 hypothetical protein [Niabella sp. W65]
MKKIFVTAILSLVLALSPHRSHAIVWKVFTEAVKKALRAADLAIQRLQNKTIGLQNAQKEVENTMSKLKLREISDWAEKQRGLLKNTTMSWQRCVTSLPLIKKQDRLSPVSYSWWKNTGGHGHY